MEIGKNYKAKLIDITKRNSQGAYSGGNDRWCILDGDEAIVAIIEPYYKNPEGIAEGMVKLLNSGEVLIDLEV